ncbi:MAG: hypothetical protein OCD76_15715 [Reichenbachiella sp.]
MADYILKDKKRLSVLLQKTGLSTFPELAESSSTEELRINILKQTTPELSFEQLSKFFILNHIYDYSNRTIINYETAITEDISVLLGSNPAHESINVQRNSGLKFPFKIWTKRTAIIQFSIIGLWLVFLLFIHLKFPDLWIFTFHLPISGIASLMIPGAILTLMLPRFFAQERFENINSLSELVDEVYFLNKTKIQSDKFSYLNEELSNYVNEKSS